MTPREVAESTDPAVLRGLLRRCCISMPPDTARARVLESGSTADLIALARHLNQRLPKGRQLQHGLMTTGGTES